jgi:hypothetical protein
MLHILALLIGSALADTDTFTATVTATATSTGTSTSTATRSPTLTPTPPLREGDPVYPPMWAQGNIQRLIEMDRTGPLSPGITQALFPNQTPQAYWTACPNRRALCISNRDVGIWIEYNTGEFATGQGDCLEPLDKWCVTKFAGATGAVWLCSPSGTPEVRLWAQHD